MLFVQVLYEIAYAFGNMTTAFSIFTMIPHARISEHSLISDISGVSTGLVVEDDEAAPDPLLLFSEPTPTGSRVML